MASVPSEGLRARAAALLAASSDQNARFTDRLLAGLMLVQWAGAIVAALVISPRVWSGSTSAIHVHVWAAILLGAATHVVLRRLWRLRAEMGIASKVTSACGPLR